MFQVNVNVNSCVFPNESTEHASNEINKRERLCFASILNSCLFLLTQMLDFYWLQGLKGLNDCWHVVSESSESTNFQVRHSSIKDEHFNFNLILSNFLHYANQRYCCIYLSTNTLAVYTVLITKKNPSSIWFSTPKCK